jgi:type VI secretion system protein ImpJ
MSQTREPVPPILWSEGMLLSPQHFQQLDLRHELLTLYHVAVASPFHWGVLGVRFNTDVLPGGLVQVQELDAILPDGLVVRHLVDRDPPLEVDVGAFREAAGRAPVTVHLAVPTGRSIEGRGGELPRFEAFAAGEVADEAGVAEPVEIDRLRPRLSLEVTTAPRQRPPAKYTSMPLARVTFDGRAFGFPDFVPPTLVVEERSALARRIQDMARKARERAHHWARRAGGEGGRAPDLQGLAAGLPALEALVASGRAHPFQLYLELCRYTGMLVALAAGQVPPVPPRYDHDDPLAAFAEVIATVDLTLDRMKQSYAPVPFQAEGSRFALLLEPEWIAPPASRLLVGISGPQGTQEGALAAWMEGARIATRDHAQELWNLRIRGASRRLVEAPAELERMLPRGTLLYAVGVDDAFVTPNEPLEIWNDEAGPGQARPSDVVLYVSA